MNQATEATIRLHQQEMSDPLLGHEHPGAMSGRIRGRRQGGAGHVGGHRGIQIATLEGDDVQELAQGHQAQGQLAGLVGHHYGVLATLTDGIEHLTQGRGRGHH